MPLSRLAVVPFVLLLLTGCGEAGLPAPLSAVDSALEASALPPVCGLGHGWTSTGSLAVARTLHTATLLSNGKVLVVGGLGSGNGGSTTHYLATAELYDPATSTWSATGSLATARIGHTATLLSNGKVLVAGGHNGTNASGGYDDVNVAELYDPATGTFSAVRPTYASRQGHTATLLNSGKVLLAGGLCTGYDDLNSASVYDPATDTWRTTYAMRWCRRAGHTATPLDNGKVLVTGGVQFNEATPLAEVYEPATGTWKTTSPLALARIGHTATPLNNGQVLVVGGGDNGGPLTRTAELYDPVEGTWSATGSLNAERGSFTATLLSSGKVLVAGGRNAQGYIAAATAYDPARGTWSAACSLSLPREGHTATPLGNGKVLVVGGYNYDRASTFTATAELYTP